MTAVAKKISEQIRHLPLEDMVQLHEHLIVSIQEKEGTERLDSEFRDEIQRRVEEIDSGKTKGVDAFKALKEM
jgi:putative addiction module component (TIGR02574 family)